MPPYITVAKCPLPCESHRSFKMFKISSSDFVLRACTDNSKHARRMNFLLGKGVVHGLHEVVTRSSFGVIQ